MLTRRQNSRLRILLRPALFLGLLLGGLDTLLFAGATAGAQFRVNTFTSGNQNNPATAMDAAGNFVVVWTGGFDQDGSGSGIFGQRFDASGAPVGPEFQVNTFTDNNQSDPAVGMDAAGNFVVAWTSSANQDGDGLGIFAQRYDASGQPAGVEFRVNTTTAGNQAGPTVATNAAGDFVIAWTSGLFGPQEVFCQRYGSTGARVGSEFRVNTSAGDVFDRPTVAMDASGEFVVAWATNATHPFVTSVRARRFDASGMPQGVEFQVNTSSGARKPAAGMDDTGNFVVAWEGSSDILVQRYNAAGAPAGSEFQVNTVSFFPESPAVAMGAAGNFVVAWFGYDQDDNGLIAGQSYDTSGAPQGNEFQVNDPSFVSRLTPAAAMDAAGNFVIAWTARDASEGGVFARRYAAPAPGLSLSIDDVSVLEGDSGTTDAIFTVSLSAASTGTVTVNFATLDGTATAGTVNFITDYQFNAGTLTFNPGDTTKTITIPVFGDTFTEADETFFVDLGSASGASILRGRGIGTILNDDFTLSIGDAFTTEGNSGTASATFSVVLSGSSTKAVTVAFATADSTATLADNDYVTNSGTLTFNPGETSQHVTVLINGDMRNEFNETFFVNLSHPTDATIADAQGRGTIRNDDFGFTVAGNQFQVNTTFFGNQFQPAIGMNAAGSFVIAWTGAVTDGSGFITGTGIFARRFDALSIVQGPDFRVDDPAFVFGQQTKPAVGMDSAGNFVVVWNGGNITAASTDTDATCELCNVYAQRFDANGTRVGTNFQVNASTPAASLRDHPSVGIYASGEFVVAWAAFGAAPPLGSGTGIFARRFDASGVPQGSEFQVNTSTPSSPRNPVVAVNQAECVIPPGTPPPIGCSSSGDFVVIWQGQASSDSDGIFARLFPGGSPGPEFRVNMYTDNIQERPAVSMDAAGNYVVAWEGEGLAFPNGPIVRGIFAQRFAAGSTAPSGWCNPLPPQPGIGCIISDLLVNTGTTDVHRPAVGVGKNGQFVITWDGFELTPSQNSAIFARSFDSFGIPQGGNEFLVNQTFPLGEFDPDVRMDAGGNFVVTWVGTDASIDGVFARRFTATPAISISDSIVIEGDSGATTATFTVTLSTASTEPVSVGFATADRMATVADNDYAARSDTVNFSTGQTAQTITITVNGDTTAEADETFVVNLSNPTNATIADGQGVATIFNDDATVSINDVGLAEGNAGTTNARFTVSIPFPSSQTVTVNFTLLEGTATTADNDYVPPGTQPGTVTIDPGFTTKEITIQVNGDTRNEPDETFSVTLSNPTNATLGKAQGVGTILNDDSMADLRISKRHVSAIAAVGEDFTYSIEASNLGPEPAPGVRVSDELPVGLTFVSASVAPSGGPCTTPSVGVRTVTCELGTLDAGSTVTVTLLVRPTIQGHISNTARVEGRVNDSNPTNNSSTDQIDAILTSFEPWIASHCPPFVPGALPFAPRVLNVAYIPAKYADTTSPALSIAQIRARADYIRDYFYQQSMCSVLVVPFLIDDPVSADGWLTLPRTSAVYHPVPENGLLPESMRIWIDAFKVASLRRPDFLGLQLSKFFDAVFVIEPDSPQRSISLITRDIARDVSIKAHAGAVIGVVAGLAGPVLATLAPLLGFVAPFVPVLHFLLPPDLLVDALAATQLFEQGSIVTDAMSEPTGIWAHELGHGLFTFWDHYAELGPTGIFSRGDLRAGGPDWGLMGTAREVPLPPIESYHRERAGWLAYTTICNGCFGTYPLVPLKDMRFLSSDALRYDNRDFFGFPRGHATYYIIERRDPPDDVPVPPEDIGKPLNLPGSDPGTPGTAQPGAVLYVKREIQRFLGIPVGHPYCGPLHGFLQSLLDFVLDHELGSCLEKVTNTQVPALNDPRNYTLRPGDSYHDDLANITFTLNANMTITVSGTAFSRAVVRMEASLQSSSASSAPATFPKIPQAFPSVDLHLFAKDGRHVGPDYVSGGYETGIAGARSGGVGTFDQWISFPDAVEASYVLDASQAVAAAQALGLTQLDITGQVTVFRYDTNGARGKLQDRVPFTLSLSVPRTTPAPIPLGSALGLIPPDTTAPVVTAPSSLRVSATEAGGAGLSDSAAVAAFLTGATAVDDIDPFVSQMIPHVNGVDVSTDMLFPFGTTTVTFRFRDAAGNVGTATADLTVAVGTPPSLVLPANIVVEATSTASTVVTFTAAATDAEDGSLTPTCSPASGTIFPLGLTSVNCSVSDSAGNRVTGSFSVTVQDTMPPQIQCGAPDAQWHATDVSLACIASDAASGLANPADASFSLSTHVAADTEAGDAVTDSRAVCDAAGNCAAAGPIAGNMVDRKAPSIAITAPSGAYLVGQAVEASYSCTDGGSGIASCVGPVASGTNFDTASAGSKVFVVHAADHVGNPNSRSVEYVVSYGIRLLYDSLMSKKAGSAYPLKVQLRDASGANLSSPEIVLHAVEITRSSGEASGPLDDTGNANPDFDFRYDAALGGYIFNLSTKGLSEGRYSLIFQAGADLTLHSAPFAVK